MFTWLVLIGIFLCIYLIYKYGLFILQKDHIIVFWVLIAAIVCMMLTSFGVFVSTLYKIMGT